MKNVKRIKSVISFIIIIIVLCIAFCFSSCAEKTSNSSIDDIFSQLVISDSETETQIPAFTDHIYVIIPDDCSGELSIKARELAD